MIRCPVHLAEGDSVTLKRTTFRRWLLTTRRTRRTRKVAVGTAKKSTEAMSFAWLVRKVRQFWDGGFLWRTMYFETAAWLISIPSLGSSPWILGAPQSGFDTDSSFAEILVDVVATEVIEPWGGGKWHLEIFRASAPDPEEWNGEM